MTAPAIGGFAANILAAAAAAGGRRKTRSGATHRTGAPVLRDSLEAGTFEDAFFVLPAPGETDRNLRACKKALDAGRKLKRDERAGIRSLTRTERLIAAMTGAAVRVFEEICTLARLNKGQVFPSYDWLAEATGLGRNTVVRVVKVLDRLGFLVRQRRFKRLEAEGAGPRYRQTSNAYRAMIPKAVIPYLPRSMRPAPPPPDVVQREADRQEEHRLMLAGLSCRDLARVHVGGSLGAALAKLGELIDVRSEANSASTEMIRNR